MKAGFADLGTVQAGRLLTGPAAHLLGGLIDWTKPAAYIERFVVAKEMRLSRNALLDND